MRGRDSISRRGEPCATRGLPSRAWPRWWSPPPWARAPLPAPGGLSAEGRRALDSVTADSLRGHLSFLASDALGGRVNGTPGLDIAAEYVAAQFRRAGLEPIGDDGYFQTAPGVVADPARGRIPVLGVGAGRDAVEIPPDAFQMTTVEPVTLEGAELVKMPPGRTGGDRRGGGPRGGHRDRGDPSGPDRREALLARQRWMRDLRAARPGADRRARPAASVTRPATSMSRCWWSRRLPSARRSAWS